MAFRLAATMALCLAAALAMAACGADIEPAQPAERQPIATPTPIPALPPAGDLLDAMAAATLVQQSARIALDAEMTVRVSDDEAFSTDIEMTGVYQAPDRLEATMIVNIPDLLEETTSLTVIGDTLFIQEPDSGQWVKQTPLADAKWVSSFFKDALRGEWVDTLHRSSPEMRVEELNGEPVYYLRYTIDTEDVDALLGKAIGGPGGATTVSIAYWVGIADYLVRKVVVDADFDEASHGVSGELSATVTLSDYGLPVDIQPPQDFVSASRRIYYDGGEALPTKTAAPS